MKNYISILSNMLSESILTEDKEGKNINYARRYLKEKGYSLEQAQKILDAIRSDMHNARIADCKFLLGIARLYLTGELDNGESIFKLNRILPYIGSDAHINEYDRNLNNESLATLDDRFSSIARQDAEKSRAESGAVQRIKNDDYTIVRIPNFEEASKYGEYTTWCVTYSENMYQSYTNDGLGLFYFCLKNGFEKTYKRKGKNCPLDKYGLSMIAVSVTEDGEPNTITCRWNHDNMANDHIMSKTQLENLLGVNFYEVFKPYDNSDIQKRKDELMQPFIEANERLKRGEQPSEIFDDVLGNDGKYSWVRLRKKYSLIGKNNELIGDGKLWFDAIYGFEGGFSRVLMDGNWSYLNSEGELIGDGELWFDDAYWFYDGLAIVRLGYKFSFINTNGHVIGDGNLWFDNVRSFENGRALVNLAGEQYYIDKDGNFYAYYTHQPIPNPLKESKRNRKKIIVSESVFNKGLLTEDKEGKNINYARRYLKEKGYSLEQAQKILDSIRSSMHNSRVADCKFLLGIARLFLNGELKDGTSIFNLNRILPYIGSDAHVNEYNRDLNGLSLEELVSIFSGMSQQDAEGSRANSYAKEHVRNNDYTIVRIPSFEDAERYSRYTTWCVTQYEEMYQKYTNDGLGLFYFCLKNGFEQVSYKKGKNCPLDEYGLSMIAVSVTEDGEPNTITCRWNHTNGGNDNIMTKDQLEELLGVNFYEVFKPYSAEDIEIRKAERMRPFIEANQKLKQGVSPNNIFDYVYPEEEGFRMVGMKDKCSFINGNNELIGNGELWFDGADNFEEGFAVVVIDEKGHSFITPKGEFVKNGNLWFEWASGFGDGYAAVCLNRKYSYIDTNFELVKNGKLWFDYTTQFTDGLARVKLENKWTYININFELIGDGKLWFDKLGPFENGFAMVGDDDKFSFMDQNGHLIENGNLWFDKVKPTTNELYIVCRNGKWSVLNDRHKLLWDGKLWFDHIQPSFVGDNLYMAVIAPATPYLFDKEGNFYDFDTTEPIPAPVLENKRNKKTIIVSENAFSRGLLTEDKEGKNINYARKYLKEKGYSLEKAQEILDAIRSDMHNARVADCKFLLGIARLYLNGELKDGTSIFNLNRILPYIGSDAHVNEYNRDLNGLSLVELVDRFGGMSQQDAEGSRANSYAKEHVRNNEYTIVRVPSYKVAKEYGRYTSWCVTHSKDMYRRYTNDGFGLFYFCLKNGFESIKEVEGENCPLDEYGLSMIAVSITEDGDPNTITCRWNHDNGGNDKIMSKDQLEDLLGVNFYEVFKPYSKEEIAKKKDELMRPFRRANERLKKGESLNSIFEWVDPQPNGCTIVQLKNKYSYVNSNNELIKNGELWFDYVDKFVNGFAPVTLANKSSLLDTNFDLIGDGNVWFDCVDYFRNGFSKVYDANKGWSFINTKGELIGDLWFTLVRPFSEGFAAVLSESNGWSFINTKGELIMDGKAWFKEAHSFSNGFAAVYLGNKGCTFVNTKGKFIGNGKLWFDDVDGFNEGWASVELDGKKTFINTKGEFISNGKLWFDGADMFNDGFALVELNDKGYSFINTKGEFIKDGKLWFSDASNFLNGLAVGHVRGVGYLVINTKEEVIRGGKFGFINAQNSQDGLYVSLFVDNEVKVYKMDKDFNFYDAQTNEPVPSPIKENKARRKTIIITEDSVIRGILRNKNNHDTILRIVNDVIKKL